MVSCKIVFDVRQEIRGREQRQAYGQDFLRVFDQCSDTLHRLPSSDSD